MMAGIGSELPGPEAHCCFQDVEGVGKFFFLPFISHQRHNQQYYVSFYLNVGILWN
jgi:hypothetical protein